MSRFRSVSEPSIISSSVPTSVRVTSPESVASGTTSLGGGERRRMTLTGAIGAICLFPLRAIISACVKLRVHPNVLTFVGVVINVLAAWALALGRFVLAGVIMIVANIFDFIDGKVAHELKLESKFGAFWDSTLDRFSDLALLVGLIYLYSTLGRPDYVLVAALTLIFSIMTSYARARAESLVEKCKVGFMERPERIVLFMIGAFTNRMAAVLWVILVLSIFSVADRVILTYRLLERGTEERPKAITNSPLPVRMLWNGFFWTFERATWQYDVMVIVILAFVWLVPPGWIHDPVASGTGPIGWALRQIAYQYLKYRRQARSALLTWDPPRPPLYRLFLWVGAVLGLEIVYKLAVLHMPPNYVFGETMLLVYYVY